MFLARVEWLPVTSRTHVTSLTHSLTDKCKIRIMMYLVYSTCTVYHYHNIILQYHIAIYSDMIVLHVHVYIYMYG